MPVTPSPARTPGQDNWWVPGLFSTFSRVCSKVSGLWCIKASLVSACLQLTAEAFVHSVQGGMRLFLGWVLFNHLL